jgi:hypothetical protein
VGEVEERHILPTYPGTCRGEKRHKRNYMAYEGYMASNTQIMRCYVTHLGLGTLA